jgi:argininosuccinate lyase
MTDGTQRHERLWGGRVSEVPSETTLRFMSGRDVTPLAPADTHLIPDDLWASAAHVTMLARQGIIPSADARALLDGLAEIERHHQQGRFALDPAREDVHTNIEMTLVEICGPEVGGRVHTGRSRNDQVATALRLYLRRNTLDLAGGTLALLRTILDLADAHRATVMPGFTHHQPATPTTLGHLLASCAEAFGRDVARLLGWLDLHNRSPLGGAAGYGTTLPLDRDLTAAYLAFDGPHLTSLDPLSTRGEPETDLALALAQLLKHLAGLAQTVILLGTPGYDLLRLSPAYTSGSSIMPQKANPDSMEVIKARAAVAVGSVSSLLSIGAASFMGYNRDTQWSKYVIIDLIEEMRDAPIVMAGALSTMYVDVQAAARLAAGHFVGSTALMEWLVAARGLPLRRAKQVVETAVLLSEQDGAGEVTDAALRTALARHGLPLEIDATLVAAVQRPEAIVHAARAVGGPAPETVAVAIAALRERLAAHDARRDAVLARIAEARDRLQVDGTALAR